MLDSEKKKQNKFYNGRGSALLLVVYKDISYFEL